jgi:hypothetical protein
VDNVWKTFTCLLQSYSQKMYVDTISTSTLQSKEKDVPITLYHWKTKG